MGLCFSSENASEIDSHHGGNDTSKSSSKVSSVAVPSSTEMNGHILESPNLKCFGLVELKEATNDFSSDAVLEEGNYGSFFKGWIDERSLKPSRPHTGMAIAVKMLKQNGCQGREELLAEIKYMGQLCHPNLVKLIGYCLEDYHRVLVYEFVPNGSLENHMFGSYSHYQPLTWNLRMKVALGAAKCLAFLHHKADVIYRDFKPSNILLDLNYNAKLYDLGLAKDGPIGSSSHISTRVLCTEGYAAPEYIRTGHLTVKCDVYSFGVVLLEMLSGRRAIDRNQPSDEQHLAKWARSIISRRKTFRVLNRAILGEHPGDSALKVAQLAYDCISMEPKFRPDMKDVVQILENIQDSCGKEAFKRRKHRRSSNGSRSSRKRFI